MQGKYKINISRDWKDPDKWHGWHLVIWTCTDLKNHGLRYRTSLNMEPEQGSPHVLIESWGSPDKPRSRRKRSRGYKPPAIPSLASLTKRKERAAKELNVIRKRATGRNSGYLSPCSWRYLRGEDCDLSLSLLDRNRALGKWLARRLAASPVRHVEPSDYAALDALLGEQVTRLSSLRTYERERVQAAGGGIKGYVLGALIGRYARTWIPGQARPFPFDEYRVAFDELRFCEELLRLRKERARC